MKRPVIFSPEAVDDIKEIYLYIEPLAGYEIAARYANTIMAYCRSLEFYPVRGENRDDLGIGYRVLGFRRRASILYKIDPDAVRIIRIFHRGRAIKV